MEKKEFVISRMKTIVYQKTYKALTEDKGKYLGVTSELFTGGIEIATAQAKQAYALTNTEMILFCTVITAKNTKTR